MIQDSVRAQLNFCIIKKRVSGESDYYPSHSVLYAAQAWLYDRSFYRPTSSISGVSVLRFQPD